MSTLDQMCLAEFAANYVTSYKCEENDDVLHNDETVELCENSKIKLRDGYGTMCKHYLLYMYTYKKRLQTKDVILHLIECF